MHYRGSLHRPPRRGWLRALLAVLALLWLASALWQAWKPLPEGLAVTAPLRDAAGVRFLADTTWTDADGARHSEQAIFDEALAMIGRAQRLIVVDMFLFNTFGGDAARPLRPLTRELTDALIRRRQAVPGIEIVLITDPVNTVYGGVEARHLADLEAVGVRVVTTDLDRLRASNPLWSGLWHPCCSWLGNGTRGGWLPNPFGAGEVTLRSWLALANFRANHRKTLVADDGDGWAALVTSANPHDASAAHGNVALRFGGAAAVDLLASERVVAHWAGVVIPGPEPADAADAPVRLQVLTESGIRDALVDSLRRAQAGDRIDVGVFYIAHRDIVRELLAAQRRGVALRVLLDPNRDAFGRRKNGVPNRQVAAELHAAGVPVRWCDTHGEQCHAKLMLKRRDDGVGVLVLGSANYTRRNLDDLNLETSVRLIAAADTPALADAAAWFEQAWSNADGRRLSLPYEAFADESWLRRAWYRIAEATGLSTF